MAAVWNYDQAARLGQYQQLATTALEGSVTVVTDAHLMIRPQALLKTSVLPNRNRLALKHITLYQDRRLFRHFQRKLREEWKGTLFFIGNRKKEGKTIYHIRDLVTIENDIRQLTKTSKDAAKAFICYRTFRPILEGLGEVVRPYWTSAGFSTLLGRKKRFKKRGRRHRRGGRSRAGRRTRHRRHRGRRMRRKFKGRRPYVTGVMRVRSGRIQRRHRLRRRR